MIINLANNKGFSWYKFDNIYFKGYFNNENGEYFEKDRATSYLNNLIGKVGFKHLISNLNGCFSIVIENNNEILAAVDRIRSFPLFYGKMKDGQIVISDDSYFIMDTVGDDKTDEIAVNEFLIAGYVTGKDTLYPNVKQLKAGEYLEYFLENKRINTERYFQLKHKEDIKKEEKELIEELDKVHIEVFQRLIKSLNGKTAVIPLSGGYDSRLVAVMLKRLGYEKVICFSYGKVNNWESQISKNVSEYLGYKWIFIPYTRKKLYKSFNSDERKKYSKFGCNSTGIAHIQDWFAVLDLKEKGLIPEDSIFIPGHAADFLEGSHIPPSFNDKKKITKNELISSIYKKHYDLWKWDKYYNKYNLLFAKKIEENIKLLDEMDVQLAASLFEEWDWQERQSKFIANSIRVYEFFGYEWRLPLWDNEMMKFWCKIKLEHRIGRKLYYEYVKNKQNIPIAKANKKRSRLYRMFDRVFDIRYGWFNGGYNIIRSILIKNDDIFKNINYEIIDNNELLFLASLNGLVALNSIEEFFI